MLIPLDTLTPEDLRVWADRARYDHLIGRSTSMRRRENAAMQVISEFTAEHPDAVCSTSWGKDSIVACWLTRMVDPNIPLVWVPTIRADRVSYEADVTYRVRDLFLQAFPGAYEERADVARNPKRGDPGWDWRQYQHPGYHHQDVLKEQIHEPYISGLRADESRARSASIHRRGLNTRNTCRPIGLWNTGEVFACIAAHNLPIHPAYAASLDGELDREWLRVHTLRAQLPDKVALHETRVGPVGRDEPLWETRYFPHLTRHKPWKEQQ